MECGEGILERKEWIVGAHRSTCLRSELLDLAQNRLKALVGPSSAASISSRTPKGSASALSAASPAAICSRALSVAEASHSNRVGNAGVTTRTASAWASRGELITLSQMLRFPCKAPLLVPSGSCGPLRQPGGFEDLPPASPRREAA